MTPRATYRLQLTPTFGFDRAAEVVPYLAALGVSHVYCSPYLRAAAGSEHGYDVVDHARINDELGGDDAHARFVAALRRHGLGQVVDLVPNHMAITPENAWWTDVLENGPASRWAGHFDVDWDPPERKLRNTVLMPVLGDHYGRVLASGDVVLERDGGTLWVRYHDHRLPLAPPTYEAVLEPVAARVGDEELAFLARVFVALPPATATEPSRARVRHRDKEVLKRALGRLLDERPHLGPAVDEELDALATDVDRLDALLERQNYRLAHWRTAGQELDYRRFFDVTALAALRMEDQAVFHDTHRLVLAWVDGGEVDGLRIDHPDGLADPVGYLARLRAAAPDAWIVVEKILAAGEELPSTWPVEGTTGYETLVRLEGAFVDADGEAALDAAYREVTGSTDDWPTVAVRSKLDVLAQTLAADLRRLTTLFVAVCEADRAYRDFTRTELEQALAGALASFDVYRTYVRPGQPASATDRAVVERALGRLSAQRPDVDATVLDLLGRVLLGEVGGAGRELCVRFQQLSGAVMAKGVEDTGFYRYGRLLALNEVGGDPGRFGTTVDELHRTLAATDRERPGTMTAGSTHDTKRSADVRARLALLAEIPDEVGQTFGRWHAAHEGPAAIDGETAWVVYQTLLGAHPLPLDRALAFVRKAVREAKVRTSWTSPDAAYEAAVDRFVEDLAGDERFQAELDAFVAPLVWPGRVNSLAMQLVRLVGPGVPDLYQGSELWDLSLVDPDNRRPVDFEARSRLLQELHGLDVGSVLARVDEGLPKLLVTVRALAVRTRGLGPYRPLVADERHAVAFLRGDDVAVVVPRLPLRLARAGGWGDRTVSLPAGSWRHELTGDEVEGDERRLADLLEPFPVALLTR